MTARTVSPVDLASMSLDQALDAVHRSLDGDHGPVQPIAPPTGRQLGHPDAPDLSSALGADEDDPDDPTVLVVSTSGTTGVPKQVLLQASALRASATATHDRLGGPGHWLLALPPHHVAGVQVLVRSVLAGTRPGALDLRSGFDPAEFAARANDLARRTDGPRYTSVVPTQLARLLDTDAVDALLSFDAVLVGGAAASDRLLARARDRGIAVVTTYGMTETCGGCVYDGVPLAGVLTRVDHDGAVHLGGPVVARGYRQHPRHPRFTVETRDGEIHDGGANSSETHDSGSTRWFHTADLGRFDGERLLVTGRSDDVIVTGGVKVSPQAVEHLLTELPGVRECLVVGVPDQLWGHRVEALVVADHPGAATEPSRTALSLSVVRDGVSTRLGRAAAPRQLHLVDDLPRLASGKPDRAAAARIAAGRGHGSVSDRDHGTAADRGH
ncbi:MAG: o-succinylbenzoate--CoA ligase [Angustibacter sp.]